MMKKQFSGFAAGVLTAALIGSIGITALAAAGGVTFNASALRLNGMQISAAGESYTLANGQSVPASITYTDEKGGGTTYLPVRRISELLGVETGWDGATGSVTVKGEVKAPATPETTPPPTNYSDWSKEDEAAYQEFKGLWEVGHPPRNDVAKLKKPMPRKDLVAWFSQDAERRGAFAVRLALESLSDVTINSNNLWFGFHGNIETERYAATVTGFSKETCSFSFTSD